MNKKVIFYAMLSIVLYSSCKKKEKESIPVVAPNTISTGMRNWHAAEWTQTSISGDTIHTTTTSPINQQADFSKAYTYDTTILFRFHSYRSDSVYHFEYSLSPTSTFYYTHYLFNDSIYQYTSGVYTHRDGNLNYAEVSYSAQWTY